MTTQALSARRRAPPSRDFATAAAPAAAAVSGPPGKTERAARRKGAGGGAAGGGCDGRGGGGGCIFGDLTSEPPSPVLNSYQQFANSSDLAARRLSRPRRPSLRRLRPLPPFLSPPNQTHPGTCRGGPRSVAPHPLHSAPHRCLLAPRRLLRRPSPPPPPGWIGPVASTAGPGRKECGGGRSEPRLGERGRAARARLENFPG